MRGLLVVARRRLWGATRCRSKCVATGLGTKPCSASNGGRPRKFAGGAKPTAVTFFGPTPRRPQHGGRPDTAHRRSWRARQSKGSVSTLCSLCLGFRPSSFASMCCTRWTWARRRTRMEIYFSFLSWAGFGHNLFSFSCMCVCACVLVCVFVCAPSARVVFCLPYRSRILLRAVEERPGLLSCGTVSNFTTRRSTRNPGCRN